MRLTGLANIQRTTSLTFKILDNTRSPSLGNFVLIDKNVRQPERKENKAEINVRKSTGPQLPNLSANLENMLSSVDKTKVNNLFGGEGNFGENLIRKSHLENGECICL